MIIKNVKIYTEEQKFVPGEIVVLGDRITEVRADGEKRQTAAEALETESSVNGSLEDEEAEEVVVDGEGAYAIPGLIDLHFHGCVGADVCDGTPEALKKIAQYEASVGVTAIAPATMTLPVEELEQILQNAAAYKRAQDEHRAANAAAGQSVQKAEQEADEAYMYPGNRFSAPVSRNAAMVADRMKRSAAAAKSAYATPKSKKPEDALNDRGVMLFNRLRELRKQIAVSVGVPPYVIFSDRTLIDMCLKVPFNEEEMLSVSGVGENKYERYGKVFMDEIYDFLDGMKQNLAR